MKAESRACLLGSAGENLVDDPRKLADALTNITRLIRRSKSGGQGTASQFDTALEMVKHAEEAMDMMEGRSQLLQMQARALAEEAEEDVCAAGQQIVSLRRSLSDSEARAENLKVRLIEVEGRVRRANDLLARFHDTIMTAFASRTAPELLRRPVTA